MTTKRGTAHTGRLHSRTAILMPPPHVREQVPKGLQTPHAPSTGVASCSLAIHRPCLQCCNGKTGEKKDEQMKKKSKIRGKGRNWGKWKRENIKTEEKEKKKGTGTDREHMKSYPWNWQHIYLLFRALMIIWEKLYSEANGKRVTQKDISWLCPAGQKTRKRHTQSQ